MSVLSKTRSVLDLVRTDDAESSARFARPRGDHQDRRRREVVIDPQAFMDLGSPEQVTVTIEPGDTLTDETITAGTFTSDSDREPRPGCEADAETAEDDVALQALRAVARGESVNAYSKHLAALGYAPAERTLMLIGYAAGWDRFEPEEPADV